MKSKIKYCSIFFGILMFSLIMVFKVAAADKIFRVSAKKFGEKWPFEIEKGTVECFNKKYVSGVFITEKGKRYSLNGAAKTKFGYPYTSVITKKIPVVPGKPKYGIINADTFSLLQLCIKWAEK